MLRRNLILRFMPLDMIININNMLAFRGIITTKICVITFEIKKEKKERNRKFILNHSSKVTSQDKKKRNCLGQNCLMVDSGPPFYVSSKSQGQHTITRQKIWK